MAMTKGDILRLLKECRKDREQAKLCGQSKLVDAIDRRMVSLNNALDRRAQEANGTAQPHPPKTPTYGSWSKNVLGHGEQ